MFIYQCCVAFGHKYKYFVDCQISSARCTVPKCFWPQKLERARAQNKFSHSSRVQTKLTGTQTANFKAANQLPRPPIRTPYLLCGVSPIKRSAMHKKLHECKNLLRKCHKKQQRWKRPVPPSSKQQQPITRTPIFLPHPCTLFTLRSPDSDSIFTAKSALFPPVAGGQIPAHSLLPFSRFSYLPSRAAPFARKIYTGRITSQSALMV